MRGFDGVFCDNVSPQRLVFNSEAHLRGSFLTQRLSLVNVQVSFLYIFVATLIAEEGTRRDAITDQMSNHDGFPSFHFPDTIFNVLSA